jgi:hypothetical protein
MQREKVFFIRRKESRAIAVVQFPAAAKTFAGAKRDRTYMPAQLESRIYGSSLPAGKLPRMTNFLNSSLRKRLSRSEIMQ